ncbi:hypothetical protein [Flavobacterium pallidum]|uniref:Uncharacterized protein n=1 Tax=Flavobacterium pallidum TaxID=2172098 RepID=A0A2S1SG05_9FLAO|nr:hypothetical protein [Flavobacterium pallidum]AWI25344.1 hypothetical protein HYN49_05210 [Flavobacterium pallidum]
MKKILLGCMISGMMIASAIYAQECDGTGWRYTDTTYTNNCSSINLGLVKIWSGSIKATSHFRKDATGETCQSTNEYQCGTHGDWEWFWEN